MGFPTRIEDGPLSTAISKARTLLTAAPSIVISSGVEESLTLVMVPLKTKNLTLLPHQPPDLLALLEGSDEYTKASGLNVAPGIREFLLAASPDFFAQLKSATAPDPWRFGFAIVHTIDNLVIGMCGFTGPPDSDATVEMAYGIVASYQGKGYATEAAEALVQFATQSKRVKTICAHTLPEINASTRVLEKCGLEKIGERTDPEGYRVWRWERRA